MLTLGGWFGVAQASPAPVPDIGEAEGTSQNGYFTDGYSIPITASCTSSQDIARNIISKTLGPNLEGSHSFTFYYDPDGSVFYQLDGGPEQTWIGCPGAGGTHTLVKSIAAKIDSASPTITVTAPVSGRTITAGAMVNVSGSAADATAGVVEVRINGNKASLNNGIFSYTLIIPSTQKGQLAVRAWAIDGASRITNAPEILLTIVDPVTTASPTPAVSGAPTASVTPKPGTSSPTPTVNPLATKTKTADQNLFAVIFSPGAIIGFLLVLGVAGFVIFKVRSKFQRPF